MYTRRRAAALCVGGLLSLGGCLDVIRGTEPISIAAAPARVSEDALAETGYELGEARERTVTREFSVGSESRTVEATNHIATYEKTLDVPILGSIRAGAFAAISTPAVEVLGRTFNPIGDYESDELLALLTTAYDGIEGGEQVDEYETSALGETATVDIFDATASIGGEEIDVYVHVTRVRSEDDFVLGYAIYPQRFDDPEAENTRIHLGGLEHPVESVE
ncbi:DUF6517 family protein [Haloferacaceae archaeon DSL9]